MKLQIIYVVATEGAEGNDKKQGEKNRQVENFPPLKEEKLLQSKSFFCFLVKNTLHIPTPSSNPTEMEKTLVNKKVFNSSNLAEHKFLVK